MRRQKSSSPLNVATKHVLKYDAEPAEYCVGFLGSRHAGRIHDENVSVEPADSHCPPEQESKCQIGKVKEDLASARNLVEGRVERCARPIIQTDAAVKPSNCLG